MSSTPSRRVRTWADLLVLIASIASLGNAMWGPTIFTAMMHDMPQGDRGVGYNWLAFGLAGILGILAVFMSMRWPARARWPLVPAGMLLVIVPFIYARPHPLPMITSVVLGIAMLVSVPFFGPMPAPRMPQAGSVRKA
jgi:hypothetical protein